MTDMTAADIIIALLVVVPWNAFLIWKMIKENKKHAANNNTPDKEE